MSSTSRNFVDDGSTSSPPKTRCRRWVMKRSYAVGPNLIAHRADEWVGIDDMIQSAQVMALAFTELLGAASD